MVCNTYSGKNVYLLFGKEVTFNTEATTIDKDIGIVNNVSPDFNNNNIAVNAIGDRESVENIAGNFDVTIGIDGNFNSGAILELFFGQSTDTETTGDYKHTFVDRGVLDVLNCVDSFSMSENFNSTNDKQFTYTGCKLNTLDVSVETGGILEFSSEVIGTAVSVDATPGTQVTTNTKKLAGFNATISTGDDGAEATVGQTKSVSVSFGNNIDPSDVKAIGSRLNQELVMKNLDSTVEFTKTFANTTEFERFLGGTTPSTGSPTDTSLILTANNGVTLGSGRIEFYVKLSGGQYESTSHVVSQDGVVEETFNYVGGNIEEIFFVDAIATYF